MTLLSVSLTLAGNKSFESYSTVEIFPSGFGGGGAGKKASSSASSADTDVVEPRWKDTRPDGAHQCPSECMSV